jgi:hypothetical protein
MYPVSRHTEEDLSGVSLAFLQTFACEWEWERGKEDNEEEEEG